MFFGESGKDKVRIGNGNERSLGLASLHRSLAGQAPGSNGDKVLLNLISGTSGIGLRLAKAGKTLLLVRLQTEFPYGINHDGAQQHDAYRMFELDSPEEQSTNQHRHIGQRSPQIGLF